MAEPNSGPTLAAQNAAQGHGAAAAEQFAESPAHGGPAEVPHAPPQAVCGLRTVTEVRGVAGAVSGRLPHPGDLGPDSLEFSL